MAIDTYQLYNYCHQWRNPALDMPRPSLVKSHPRFASVGIDRSMNYLTINFQNTIQVVMSNGDKKNESDNDDDDDTDDDEQRNIAKCKSEIFKAAGLGDIDALEELLEKYEIDINITWYNENLLMAAIRKGQQEVAEFLVDNGVNYNYESSILDVNESNIDKYTITCRQMAYDRGMQPLVDLIDSKNGKLFKFIKLQERTPRLMKQRNSTLKQQNGDRVEVTSERDRIHEDNASSISTKTFSHASSLGKPDSTDLDQSLDNDTDSGLSGHADGPPHFDESFLRLKGRTEPLLTSTPVNFRQRREAGGFLVADGEKHDEGYSSVSPKGSRRGSPAWKADVWRQEPATLFVKSTKSSLLLRRENARVANEISQQNTFKREVNAPGSYNRESMLWSPSRSSLGDDDTKDDSDDDEISTVNRTQVRTQSPWRDDKPAHIKRHRKPPSLNLSIQSHGQGPHQPRIMSPPTQPTNRTTRVPLHATIVTLPDKMSCPSHQHQLTPQQTPRTLSTTAIAIERKATTSNATSSSGSFFCGTNSAGSGCGGATGGKRITIPFGKNMQNSKNRIPYNKYDEHFVTGREIEIAKKNLPFKYMT